MDLDNTASNDIFGEDIVNAMRKSIEETKNRLTVANDLQRERDHLAQERDNLQEQLEREKQDSRQARVHLMRSQQELAELKSKVVEMNALQEQLHNLLMAG